MSSHGNDGMEDNSHLDDTEEGCNGWASVPSGKCTSALSVVDDRFDLLCCGTDGELYAHSVVDGKQANMLSMGGSVNSGTTSPAAVAMAIGKTVVVVAVGTDDRLHWTKSGHEHGED